MQTETKQPPNGAGPSIGERLAGKYMSFKLAEETYGLGILRVREIIGMMDITRVPRSPRFVRGVINLRGKVIPVIDLRLKFEMPATVIGDQTVIIVVQCDDGDRTLTMGILVDEVLEVLNVTAPQIEPPPMYGTSGSEAEFILGVGKAGDRVVFLLDINRVLTSKEKLSLPTKE